MQRRLTLRPKAHIDPIGTLGVPAVFLFLSLIGQPIQMFFAYGKPIENNFRSLKNSKRDQVLIGLTGPAVNLILAVGAGIAGSVLTASSSSAISTAGLALLYLMSVNIFILVVNIFPLPPLAGSRVLMPFLSPKAQYSLQQYSRYLILLLVVIFFLRVSLGVNILGAMTNPLCRAFTRSGARIFCINPL
ncbi:MAG: site-2 protease family protein [Actinomycetota bacterium]